MTVPARRQLFLDCDGVLADFDTRAREILGTAPRDAQAMLGVSTFWQRLRSHEGFYAQLPLMADAERLFDAVRHLSPVILTGCPIGGWADAQKQRWAAKHFPGTKMITCLSRDKRLHMKPGDVLVDDSLTFRHLWVEASGVFVHHTSAENTLLALHQVGLLGAIR